MTNFISKESLTIVLALFVAFSAIAGALLLSPTHDGLVSVVHGGGGGGEGGGGSDASPGTEGMDVCGNASHGDSGGFGGPDACCPERWCTCPPVTPPTDPGGGSGGGGSGGGSSCVPNQGDTCSAANICGQVNVGTIGCDGTCNVGPPSVPSGSCSVTTVCGTATGSFGCNARCNISSYPVCLAPGGEVTWITVSDNGNGDGSFNITEAAADLFAQPLLVSPGTTTLLRWISTETTGCSISGTNGDSFEGLDPYGEMASGVITEETVFTLTCSVYDSSTLEDTVRVRVVPLWQEF